MSHRLKSDYNNGAQYYRLKGSFLLLAKRDDDRPGREFLE